MTKNNKRKEYVKQKITETIETFTQRMRSTAVIYGEKEVNRVSGLISTAIAEREGWASGTIQSTHIVQGF